MIAALKFLHLLALGCWCAALLALPLLLRAYGGGQSQRDYDRFRLITHLLYIAFATPAAVITIVAGMGLMFAASVFEPWFLVKLACVAGMVLVHIWFGHLIQRSGEERRSSWRFGRVGGPLVGLGLALPLIGAVLGLVLIKPDLGPVMALIPDQFLSPRAALPPVRASEGVVGAEGMR